MTLPGRFVDYLRARVLYAVGFGGSTAPSRYVGATVTGAPTTGTYARGDFVVSHDGTLLVCTTAGTPGTWVATANQTTNFSTLTLNGQTLTAVGSDLFINGQRLARASELTHDHTGTYATPATNTTTTHSHPA